MNRSTGFIHSINLRRDRVPEIPQWPFTLPFVRGFSTIELHPQVTVIVGENGSGKSTLLEAVAVCAGFNAEGGTKQMNFSSREEAYPLADALHLARNPMRRESGGFFLRAESFFNIATYIDDVGMSKYYGSQSLHTRSHGEAFLALSNHRFEPNGLYILDEPESALSPQRQLALLRRVHTMVNQEGCQFIISTHSPILMAYPDSLLYEIDGGKFVRRNWKETGHYTLTRSFLNSPEAFLRRLLGPDDDTQA